ncbi:uncharacterized protein TNCV_4905821 [Trichonephila clavipes]|uniref:Uncharacterized protein n=1 Tax=Trichonephila clavipes TaxID=2585209 RepID=A0A8X6RM33_TRICX|nr:uncharacterized protein TNCV_4905821 [Trichonephila clavipes]
MPRKCVCSVAASPVMGQQALATNTLSSYPQDYPTLPTDIAEALYRIYEDLINVKLLERYVGGSTQSNKESYNPLIWKITQKIVLRGSKVEIAAYIATGMFNEGTKPLLYFVSTLELSLGTEGHDYVEKEDAERLNISEARSHGSTREGGTA